MKRVGMTRRTPLSRRSLASRLVRGNREPLSPEQIPDGKAALKRFIRTSRGKDNALGIRRPGKQPVKWLEQELDELARKLCRKIAGERCERCGGANVLQWHHIVTRRVKALRWDMRNALCLCKGCHFWWHNLAQMGEQWAWLEQRFGERRRDFLRIALAAAGKSKVDRQATRIYLKGELARHGE